MTNKHNNWERIAELLAWLNMNVNRFAQQLGIARAESLYQIKRGNYGISRDLAKRIVENYPQVDHTWLLSGVGSMLHGQKPETVKRIPYHSGAAESNEFATSNKSRHGSVTLPYEHNIERVVRSMSPAMCDGATVATDLFIRQVSIEDVIQGNEYVIELNNGVIWRKVRYIAGSDSWRLVAINKQEYEDIIIDKSQVVRAWRVVARMAILES